ncbi:unnamed protein product [Cyclocybe aegerita]|uniref:F-box domain-containing protein n=1 Tax=Cyclocybe aegerita TaxID=1973307 RepID=A0A8S0Y0T5_CYCAE|nr:unnamed protein product [Cyclocybe aegerita]
MPWILFSNSSAEAPNDPSQSMVASVFLGSVCRRWREIVEATPRLWTSIAINTYRSDRQATTSSGSFHPDQFDLKAFSLGNLTADGDRFNQDSAMQSEYVKLENVYDCPCTLPTCPAFIAKTRLANMQPRQAVVAASRDTPDSIFFGLVAAATLCDPRYRRAGAGKVFVDHLVSGLGRSTGVRPHWEYLVMGIINVLAPILPSDAERQDVAICQSIYPFHSRIVDTLLADFDYLTQKDDVGDSRRFLVAKMLLLFMDDPETKRHMCKEKTLRLLVHCWLETSPACTMRKTAAGTVLELLVRKDSCGNSPPPDYLDRLFKAVQVPNFVSRINFSLKHKNLPAETLHKEISILRNLTESWLPFSPKLLKGSVSKQVVAAVRRILKNDPQMDKHKTLPRVELFIQ